MPPLLVPAPEGLFCAEGGFHVDPRVPVPLAVVTHAHADHATPGCRRYLCAAASLPLLAHRLGPQAVLEGVAYGERRMLSGAMVLFHPAGHILGSAQVRIEGTGTVWVVTGDYKRESDPTCAPFEIVEAISGKNQVSVCIDKSRKNNAPTSIDNFGVARSLFDL